MKKLLIIGSGGQGKVVLDCALLMNKYSSISFLTNDLAAKEMIGHPVYFEQEVFSCSKNGNANFSFYSSFDEIIVAIGNNKVRLNKALELLKNDLQLATLIHPKAVVSKLSTIREGSVVFANAVVNPFSTIGIACIINTGAIIEHDCVIGDGVHISPNASIAGTVSVGKNSWVCIGSSVINNISIGENSTIGAGSVVLKNVPCNVLVAGVPAKIKKHYT